MTDTLDDIGKKSDSIINSIWSFLFSIATILFFISMLSSYPTWQRNGKTMRLIFIISNACVILSNLTGMIFTVRSFYKKEPSSFLKWTGAILNTLLFIFIIFAFVYFIYRRSLIA